MPRLPTLPATPTDPEGRLAQGRWVGTLGLDPVTVGPRSGRVRRWLYVAAGDDDVAVGAAVVDLGIVVVAFAWVMVGGATATWETRRPLGRGAWVAPVPAGGAGLRARDARVDLDAHGGLVLDVPTRDGRLTASIESQGNVEPVVLSTPTPGGGWNVTQKSAGYGTSGWMAVDDDRRVLSDDAGGWRDWTAGRQDRRTTWTWAAGTGRDGAGRAVGLNASTGMNGRGPGENVVWWDGRAHALPLERLAPEGRPVEDGGSGQGPWRVAGPDWALRFESRGVRAADENLLVMRSRYVQPIGRFVGTLPGPDGEAVEVTLTGVTEDHLAVW